MIEAVRPRMTIGFGNSAFLSVLNMRVIKMPDPIGKRALGKPILVESPAASIIGAMAAAGIILGTLLGTGLRTQPEFSTQQRF